MKKTLTFVLLLWLIVCLQTASGQNLQTAFEFTRLPSSAHGAALGGNVVSIPDADIALFLSNPALLAGTTSSTIGLNAMTWFAQTKVAGASWSSPLDDRSRYAFNAMYVNYGKMEGRDASGIETGTFKSKDMEVGITYAYKLADNLDGGVTGNFICPRYSSKTSIAVGVNIGLLYSMQDKGVTIGLAATNLGGQVKAFENTFQKIPFNLSTGVSWKPAHAPLRFTLTLDRLTDWEADDFYFTDEEKRGFSEILKRHMSYGVDLFLTERFYLAAGCNLCRRLEMSEKGSRGFTGMTTGAGLHLDRFSFFVSYGKYQVSESSLLLNIAFIL